jgi:hypothetical protein
MCCVSRCDFLLATTNDDDNNNILSTGTALAHYLCFLFVFAIVMTTSSLELENELGIPLEATLSLDGEIAATKPTWAQLTFAAAAAAAAAW